MPLMHPQPHLSLSDVKTAMAATNEIFTTEVVGKRNFAALDDVYTSGARILPPGAPMITGREEIKKFWSDLVAGANATAVVLRSVDVMPTGEGVVEIGEATLTTHAEGKPVELAAKYVVYWQTENGRWKWHVDIWNPNS
jgi:ketosteroid isomerase-like protein